MAETKKQITNEGIILAIAGPVVNVHFEGELPSIYEAITSTMPDGKEIVMEVQFLTGDHEVKAIAFGSTDGISRGTKVKRTGNPISVPVGEKTLGRIFNVLGQTIDGQKFDPKGVRFDPIHA